MQAVASQSTVDPGVTLDGYEDYATWCEPPPCKLARARTRILILCGGTNSRENYLFKLFKAHDSFECVNYDLRNGPQFDLMDDAGWDALLRSVNAWEYAACFACPDCATFSKLHSLPGPPPLRDVEGPGRYGRKGLTPEQNERIRKHTLVATRVAKLLVILTKQAAPWIFEAPWATAKMVSILNLDEYMAIACLHGAKLTNGGTVPVWCCIF